MVFCFVQNFFPEFHIRLYDKNSESVYFLFPPPKSEYFFQQHGESEYWYISSQAKKKISNFPSNFYHKFLVENCRAGLMIFLHLSCQFILLLQWDDDEVRFVLDQHTELDFYSASSLKQQSADRHVAPLGHIILIPSRPVFAVFLSCQFILLL
jgi:hypothetical protein